METEFAIDSFLEGLEYVMRPQKHIANKDNSFKSKLKKG